MSEWTSWSSCSKTCSGGTRTRERSVLTQKQYGGESCPKLQETHKCNTKECPPRPGMHGYHDDMTEFVLLSGKLTQIGMKKEDAIDLKILGSKMNDFLIQVDDIEVKLEMKKPHNLKDHIQSYLLGLPNKLGPLGFLTLHHVLTTEETDAIAFLTKVGVVPWSSEQLEELQDIIERDHDEMTEFELISNELAQMGAKEEDIVDLKLLGSMMNDFLIQVDDIEVRLETQQPHDLMDHIQLYLLGLPNKLGPLGFIAFRHVLLN